MSAVLCKRHNLRMSVLWKNKSIGFLQRVNSNTRQNSCVDLEIRIQAFENKCCRRMVGLSYKEHSTVCMAAGQYPRWTSATFIFNRRKLSWFCRHDTLPKSYFTEQRMAVVANEDHANHVRTYQGMERPVIVVGAAHPRRQKYQNFGV